MKKFMSKEHADILTRYHMGMVLGYDIMTSLHDQNTKVSLNNDEKQVNDDSRFNQSETRKMNS